MNQGRSWGLALKAMLLDLAGSTPAAIAEVSQGRPLEAPSRIPIRKLALATGLTGIVAQVLSLTGGGGGGAEGGPLAVVVGQALWNAAQVGLLLLLLSLLCVHRRRWVVALAVVTLACLPFAIYVISPGGRALTVLLLATCGLARADHAPDLDVALVDAPARGTPMLTKFEFLAFVCYLLCSMYNFFVELHVPPYWDSIFRSVGAFIGFTSDPATIAHVMYGLGLDGVRLPSYIKLANTTNSLGAVIFALIWTVLPCLYVLYFAALAKMAKNSPGTRLQHALCLFGIFHFLFLTDFVDYWFGRGIVNPAADMCHISEVFAWHIAVLLPIYQKVASGQWLRGNGVLGVVLHCALAVWATGWFFYNVLMYNVPFAYAMITGGAKFGEYRPIQLFGRGYSNVLGYFGTLVFMMILYGFMVLAMRGKRIVATRAECLADQPLRKAA